MQKSRFISEPLSRHQQAIWLESQLHPGNPIFNIGTYVRLSSIPDAYLLEKAIASVILQNDALRMCIYEKESHPRQRFDNERSFKLPIKKFDGPDASLNARVWMQEEFVKPIDIQAPVLYQFVLVQSGNGECYLFFKHHHIYIDGWGRALLVRKIANQYNALLQGEFLMEPGSYAECISQMASSEKETHKEEAINFWKDLYSGFERSSLFPKKQPNVSNSPGGRHRLALERDIYNQISLPGYEKPKGQFYFLLALFYLSLSRATGKKEVVVGIPLLNRFDESQKHTIGYFVGIIPLRLSFGSEMSLFELAENIRVQMRSTVPHRGVSIHEINQALGINFSNGTQLYDVVFSYEPHDHDCHFGESVVVDSGTFSSDYEQTPLVVHVQDFNSETAVNIEFDYNLNHLDTEEASIISRRFERLIHHFLNNAEGILNEAPVLFEDETALLHEFAKGATAELSTYSLTELFQQNALSRPDDLAVTDGETVFTFQEVWQLANQCAQELLVNGVKKGDTVGILMQRSIDTFLSIAGVLLSGGVYVPIDSELPQSRIGFMLEEARINVVISDSESCHLVDSSAHVVIGVSREIEPVLKVPVYPLPEVKPEDGAYVIFTSGTTGQPKGVEISHQSVINLIDGLNREVYGHYPIDTRLGFTASFSFDPSIQHMFACLLLGYPLYIALDEHRKDSKKLIDFLVRHEIEICDTIPTQLSTIMARVPVLPAGFKVRHYLIGAEALKPELVKQFYDWIPYEDMRLTNLYGPTECTVEATFFHMDRHSHLGYNDIPIGRPFQNVELWVLDENQQIVPPGTPGELFIGGAGLSSGYVNRQDLTDQKFKMHKQLGKRFYRTGDLVKWDENGCLLFKGRIDNQVKIRGFRIELTEIEHHLAQIPGVQQVYVFVRKIGESQVLVGCVQAIADMSDTMVKDLLIKQLPHYMVPHFIHFFDAFPLTHTGKIDRKKLLSVMDLSDYENKNYSAPETPTEKRLAHIWQELLELKTVDIDDGFFTVGGDSLSLVYLLAKIEAEFKIELSMRQFATNNSVREIAKRIESSTDQEREQVSLEKELPDLEVLSAMKSEGGTEERNVALLTGVTGFVGAFILQELAKTYKQVYCLIRGENQTAAESRFRYTLKKYGIRSSNSMAQVEVLKGDLAEENLGLSESNLQLVRNSVDVIFHCGAMVNFLTDFDMMKSANIDSTMSLLQICKQGKSKQFNYISTKGVFSSSERDHHENSTLSDQVHYKDRGYESTKWIAENLTDSARAYGVNCNIFRLGRITGESTHGIARYDDFFHRFIQGCILLNSFPEELLDMTTDLTPVDITAQTIVGMAECSANENFHLINHHRITYREMLDYCMAEEMMMDIVSYDEWLQKVGLLNAMDAENPLFAITPILREKKWLSASQVVLRSQATASKMRERGIEWLSAHSLWRTYVKDCVKRTQKELVPASIII